ncbi:hypothetical protein BDZ94DRAFT_422035 [Collybia nuda]|uniref:Uncharacterized protein n=1 Tax=Collybia nuda TaxID=64659 RepID=A0A9P5XR94_9AGAR|nr:hypothetical protein BDZ94DRAFT_422035 [Collybia nuda]
MIISGLFSHLRIPIFGRRRRIIKIEVPPDLLVDARGLPGDLPGDVPFVLPITSSALHSEKTRWCIVGDILLEYYGVPKVVGDIEICLPSEDLANAFSAVKSLGEFCYPFRPLRGHYTRHAAPHSRFRVKGMNQCFVFIPAEAYGLSSADFSRLLYPSLINFPLLPLPTYIQGLCVALANEP